MLRDAVRGVVVVATELAEETGKRVVGAAAGLLERSGVDVAAIERTVGEQFPPSAKSLQTLAEEAVTAGRAGLDMAVGVARGEIDKVFERVGDQVVKVGVVLSYLESKLREVEEQPHVQSQARPEGRADGLFDAGWDERAPEPEKAVGTDEADGAVRPTPAKRTGVKRAAAAAKPVAKPGVTTAAGRASGRSTAKAAGPGAARKTAATKTTPSKTTAPKTTAPKTAAAKPAAPKTGAKGTSATRATAKKAGPKKGAAAKKAAPKKAGGDV
ncbi:hypothetical protein [Kitasatospora sp. GP82]|uniref:hypothetical protein n=1 Tax=Kitasatospora sp. GP82 TaxID=3035089 RepID=UPI002476D546|nr:hypothetical protein [Kitasatospora sp. GP82]MDH6128465.1 hypothetical protein [Kitasatospora sp. GP82]